MKTKEEAIAILKEHKEYLRKKYKVIEISLFGSLIRGEQNESSDIDVLVELEEGADLLDLISLGLYLEEKLDRTVDVIPKRALREEIRDSVLKDLVPV